jgi:hypothetical protein
MSAPNLRCSFCGRHHDEVARLTKGRTSALICDLCVGEAAAVMVAAGVRVSLALPAPANDGGANDGADA